MEAGRRQSVFDKENGLLYFWKENGHNCCSKDIIKKQLKHKLCLNDYKTLKIWIISIKYTCIKCI